VKALHINQTVVNGTSCEVPFQIEDWGSNYGVPLGLTSNVTVFNSMQMLVFLVNHNVEEVTLWWDGRDIANQTAYAFTNKYFKNDNPSSRMLTNGNLTLTFSPLPKFTVTSSIVGGNITSTASFLRINNNFPVYYADPAYVIYHGIVRDVVQQEAEWEDGGIIGCPDLYAQIVLTLPANATYYTYTLRTIFVNSSQPRTITDLSLIQLSVGTGQPLTENGTIAGFPANSTAEGLFYNFTSFSTGWAHHWSEFISGNAGAGIMFSNDANQLLYFFDDIAGLKTGALNVISSGRVIEFNPVEMASASFQSALDISWYGAVVSFDGTDPIYPSSGDIGLWVLVEFPPSIAVG